MRRNVDAPKAFGMGCGLDEKPGEDLLPPVHRKGQVLFR